MAAFNRKAERDKRHKRIRKKISGTSGRPRLCVSKSLRHIRVQLIDDEDGRTLVSASTNGRELRKEGARNNIPGAEKVGALLAKRTLEKGIETVVFDRGGYLYHGVVAAVADGCRKGGLRL